MINSRLSETKIRVIYIGSELAMRVGLAYSGHGSPQNHVTSFSMLVNKSPP